MRLLSLNVGRPVEVAYRGSLINTGIFKQPSAKRLSLRKLNLEGDQQADLTVHGGLEKAVYGYPSEHYEFWRLELPEADLPWGAFGENFTTIGLREHELAIGDRFSIGSAIVTIRQPRMPCYKLAAKFERDDMISLFMRSGRSGFYFSVEQEGEVGAEDDFELLSQQKNGITIAEMNSLLVEDKHNRTLLQKAINTPALPKNWRDYFIPRLHSKS